jgi:hypothetical protein
MGRGNEDRGSGLGSVDEKLGEWNAEIAGEERAAASDAFRLPEWYCHAVCFSGSITQQKGTPEGMIFLTFGEHRSDAILGGEDFDAKEDGFGGVGTLDSRRGNYIGDEVFCGAEADVHLGKRLDPLATEQHL